MKSIQSIVFLTVMFVSLQSNSQTDKIQKIRDRYQEITSMIDEEFLTPISLTFGVNRPAIGMQNTKILFYWNNMESEGYEDDGNGDVEYMIHRELYMITCEYNVAASVFYHIEYLFDANGELIFYYSRTEESEMNEERLYFSDQKLIKVIHKTFEVTPDGEQGEQLSISEKTNGFNAVEQSMSESVLKKGTEYVKHFNDLFGIEGK